MNHNNTAVEKREKAGKRTMQEMDEQYKSCPVRTSTYEIDGVKHKVVSHFVGDKDINDVMFSYAYNRVLNEMLGRMSCSERK